MLQIRLPRPTPIAAELLAGEPCERLAPEEVVMYRCQGCHELHDDEDDAIDCCPADDEDGGLRCPCCGTEHDDADGVVDCCMWKTHSIAERQALAQQLRAYGYLLDSALVGMVTEGALL